MQPGLMSSRVRFFRVTQEESDTVLCDRSARSPRRGSKYRRGTCFLRETFFEPTLYLPGWFLPLTCVPNPLGGKRVSNL